LASELTRAEQRERRRLAQILHDHLQQLLVAARLKLSIVRSELRDEARQGPEQLEQIDHTLDEAITVSRSLTAELSPRILYDAGLPAALEWLAADMEKKHGLAVKVYADPAANPAEETLREFLFQAVREGLFNVVKHAQIGHAIVRVIGLSMHEEEAAANAMREAGAVAYLTKGEDLDSLIATILG
jgi:signal transduction histidine kinase